MIKLKMGGKSYGEAPDWMAKVFKKQGFNAKRIVKNGKRLRIVGKAKNVAKVLVQKENK